MSFIELGHWRLRGLCSRPMTDDVMLNTPPIRI